MGKIKRQNVNTHLLGPPSSFAGNANMKETTPTPRITGFPLPQFPLGKYLFPKRSIMRPTRSINYVKAVQPVPGNNTLAANLMARAWNSSSELQTATTIGAARTVAQKWARNLLL